MNECGTYKEKGIPVSVAIMYFQAKTRSCRETFCKDTACRFLENARMNGQMFLPELAKAVACDARSLASDGKRCALTVDGAPLSKRAREWSLSAGISTMWPCGTRTGAAC